MDRKMSILVLLGLLATGCMTHHGDLINMNTEQILMVAAREIAAKCPEFRMQDFEPAWVYYHESVNPRTHGTISVTYLSRKPSDVRDRKSLTNGPPHMVSTYRSAEVSLSDNGELRKQNVSEWSEFPEWSFVRFSEVTRVTPKKEDTSNQPTNATSQ